MLSDEALYKRPKVAYYCSLTFSPGLLKDIRVLARQMQNHGWTIRLLLSDRYRYLQQEGWEDTLFLTTSSTGIEVIQDCITYNFGVRQKIAKAFRTLSPDYICFYNPHVLNEQVAILAEQANSNCVRSLFLHEPFVTDKSPYGLARGFYISVVEYLQQRLMRHLNSVIVPSQYSLCQYQNHYPPGKRLTCAPLLAEDRGILNSPREYISFVGNINKGRSLQEFVALANYAATRGDYTRKFLIVTRSPIDSFLNSLTSDARRMVRVVNKEYICDAEINEALSSSRALFLSHTQASQSANVPAGFMHGTPIICRNIAGLTQHIHHMQNGYVLPYVFRVDELYEAVLYVENHWTTLSQQARRDYEENYDAQNWEKYYGWLL